ncbi:MAG: hypothetical protein K2N05_02810 [Muribaculaceae bacterium]|nr:hypothetical protein [Muribaculaceae bacterium]
MRRLLKSISIGALAVGAILVASARINVPSSFKKTEARQFPAPRLSESITIVPAQGEVESLQSFTITFADVKEVAKGDVTYSNAPYVLPEGSGDKKYCFGMSFEGNSMTLSVSSALTEPGNYILHLPIGFYTLDGENVDQEYTFEYTIPGSTPVRYSLNILPEAGEVESLKTFTVTFDGATELAKGNLGYGNAPYVMSPEWNDKKYCFDMSFEGNVMTLGVSSEITEPGEYTLHIPAGFYTIDGAEADEEYTFDYVIAGEPPVDFSFTITPAAGNVSSLQNFTLLFAGAKEVTKGDLTYSNAPYVLADGSDDKQYCFNMSFEENTMNIGLSAEISEPGEYTLHIPAGFYNVDGETSSEDYSFTYTILKDPIGNIEVSPVPGEVTSLKTFTLLFEGASEVAKGNLGYSNAPYVMSPGWNDKKYCFDMNFEGNVMTLGISSEITEPGSYTLHVPAGFYTVDGEEAIKEYTFDYTVVESLSNGIINEAPAGTKVECQTNFLSWFVSGGMLGGQDILGKPIHYVIGEDDCLYLYNPILLAPFGNKQCESYIKGEKDGDAWTFVFPQPVYTKMEDGKKITYYANLMHNEFEDEAETSSTYMVVPEEKNKISFIIDSDGNCKPASEEDYDYIVGAANAEGKWNGFGNVRMEYSKVDFTAFEPAEGVEIQDWIMEYSKGDSSQRLVTDVKVAIKDTDIWVKGFSQLYCAGAWAHGTIDSDDNILFDPYLGVAESVGQYAFVYSGIVNSTSNIIYPLEMSYDREAKKITCEMDLLINPNQVFYYTLENFVSPVLSDNSIELTTRIPKAPLAIKHFQIIDQETGKAQLQINVSSENIDDQPLKPENLYYQILLPGFRDFEVYELTPELYPELTETMTDIPYNIINGLVTGMGVARNLYVYVPDNENIGARMVYKDETGTYYSDPVFYYEWSGVNNISDNIEVVATKWLDLTGCEVSTPTESGIFIRIDTLANGKTVVRKISFK